MIRTFKAKIIQFFCQNRQEEKRKNNHWKPEEKAVIKTRYLSRP
jgi:hypothetical protein